MFKNNDMDILAPITSVINLGKAISHMDALHIGINILIIGAPLVLLGWIYTWGLQRITKKKK